MKNGFNPDNIKSPHQGTSDVPAIVDYEAKYPQDKGETTIVGIGEYRKILGSRVVTDERLIQIVGYLQGMSEMVIRREREKYEQEIKQKYAEAKI